MTVFKKRTEQQVRNTADWVQWLQNPALRQAHGTLRKEEDGSMCCLGVYCVKVADVLPGEPPEGCTSTHAWFKDPSWEYAQSMLVPFDWLEEQTGLHGEFLEYLTEYNDSYGFSLRYIGYVIECQAGYHDEMVTRESVEESLERSILP